MFNKIGITFLLSLTATATDAIFCTGECPGSGIRCVDPYIYQYCVNQTDYAVGATSKTKCPDGSICDGKGAFPCKKGTVPVPTTTPTPITAPPCSEASKTAINCTSYFECAQVLWWWEPSTKTCPTGQNFDPSSNECVDASVFICPVVIIATTLAPIEPPQCSGFDGKFPAQEPNEYYECIWSWFQWVPQLKTCPSGKVFDVSKGDCI